MQKLNLGCGTRVYKDYVNLDYHKHSGVDVVHDLNEFPWPFKENTFDEVLAVDIVEHLPDVTRSMKELYRICKNGAIIRIQVPHFSSATAHHEEHYHFFRWKSFGDGVKDLDKVLVFGKMFKLRKKKIHFFNAPYTPSLLHSVLFYNYFVEKLVNIWRLPLIYENTFLRSLFPAIAMYFELEVVKQ